MKSLKSLRGKKTIIIGIVIMLVFSVLVGKFLTKMAYEMAVKDIEVPVHSSGFAFTPHTEADLQSIDTVLKEKDNSYKGYFSLNAMQGSVICEDKEKLPALILDEHYNDQEFLIKEYSGKIEEGLYPIYVTGKYWESYKLGNVVKIDFTRQNGEIFNVNGIIVGELNYRSVPLFYSGNAYLDALNGTFAIEGLDINTFVENPYKNIVLNAYSYQEIHSYGTNNLGANITSRKTLETVFLMNVINNISTYSIYLFIASFILFLLLNFFLGGKHKAYFYLGFSVLVFLFSLVFLKVDILQNNTTGNGILLTVASGKFYLYQYISIGVVLLVGIVAFGAIFMSDRAKEKKLKALREVKNDTAL